MPLLVPIRYWTPSRYGYTPTLPLGAVYISMSTHITCSGTTDGFPVDATRTSQTVHKLESILATNGIMVEAMKRGRKKDIRLRR